MKEKFNTTLTWLEKVATIISIVVPAAKKISSLLSSNEDENSQNR